MALHKTPKSRAQLVDDNPIHKLSKFGRPVKDPSEWNCSVKCLAHDLRFSDLKDLQIVVSEEEKAEAADFWEEDLHEIGKILGKHGLRDGDLEPLMYNACFPSGLILYDAKDECFWVWKDRALSKVGHWWVDIFDPHRCF
jgi:hypothetical protein